MARCFFALIPDDSAIAQILEMRHAIAMDGVRLTPPANLHVTLKFLGEITEAEIAELIEYLPLAIEDIGRFYMSVDRVAYLPNIRRPRVVAASGDAVMRLVALHDAVEKTCAALGHPSEDRPYHPHITLGRFRRSPRKGTRLPEPAMPEVGWKVQQVTLMQSHLTDQGPRYETRHSFTL